jgi:small GTP-binding protein
MTVVHGKVVFVGDCGVGKTCIIASYNKNPMRPGPTIAADSVAMQVNWKGRQVALTVFDTAGQDDYRCLVPLYARFAQVGVIVYDQTSRQSFNNVSKWIDFLKSNSDVPHLVLVANKVDLPPAIESGAEDELATTTRLEVIRTSAITGQNIDILFTTIAGIVESDPPPNQKRSLPGLKQIDAAAQPTAPGDCQC